MKVRLVRGKTFISLGSGKIYYGDKVYDVDAAEGEALLGEYDGEVPLWREVTEREKTVAVEKSPTPTASLKSKGGVNVVRKPKPDVNLSGEIDTAGGVAV